MLWAWKVRQPPIDSLSACCGCTQASLAFWRDRLHYFKNGLYYQGGMVKLSATLSCSLPWHVPSMAICLQHGLLQHWRPLTGTAALNVDSVTHLQGQVVWLFQILMRLIGLGGAVTRVATAPTLEHQRKAWEATWPVRWLTQ